MKLALVSFEGYLLILPQNLLGESSFKLSALSFKLQKFLQPLKPLSFYVEVPVKGAVSDENIAKMATIEVKIPVNLKSGNIAFC